MSEEATTRVLAEAREGDVPIRINLLLFASVAEAVGQRQLTVDVSPGTTAREALRLLGQEIPELCRRVDYVSFARNQEFVGGDAELEDGDELAVIPPVSGGAWA